MDGNSPKKPANFFRYLVVQTKLLFFFCARLYEEEVRELLDFCGLDILFGFNKSQVEIGKSV